MRGLTLLILVLLQPTSCRHNGCIFPSVSIIMSALTVSALRSSPNTPIRATTSNLSLRAAPPVPSANQNYEPLAKAVLQKRLISTLFPYSAAFVWVASVISLVSVQGGVAELGFVGTLLQPLRPSTLALTALSWGLSAVPVVVVRKRYSSGESLRSIMSPTWPNYCFAASPTAATSPSQIFHTAWSKPSTFHALVTYTGSALFLLLLHLITSCAFESDPRLSLFVKSKYVHGPVVLYNNTEPKTLQETFLLSQWSIALPFLVTAFCSFYLPSPKCSP